MPRRPDRRQINATVSAAQYEVIQALAGPDGIAAYLRVLVATDAARRGVRWPDDLPGPGEYPRREPAGADGRADKPKEAD